MNLLALCQAVSTELQLPNVAVVASGSSIQARRLLRYANKSGVGILRAWDWPQLRVETTFVATATELQESVLPADFGRLLPQTLHNRTTWDEVHGPLTPRDWQRAKLQGNPDPSFAFRLDPATGTNGLYMLPTPAAGDTFAFEYVSAYWVTDAGGTEKGSFTVDTDTCSFDDDLMINRMCAQWLMAEGQPSAHVEMEYKDLFRQITKQLEPTGGILVSDIPIRHRWSINNDV